MRQLRNYIISIVLTVLMLSCTGGSDEGRAKDRPVQASDTVYTEPAIMETYASNPERALLIIDSAKMVGNLTDVRAELMRATTLVRELRLDHAVRLLNEQPELTIEQICQASGFANTVSFNRSFKAKYGMTPTDFRGTKEYGGQ